MFLKPRLTRLVDPLSCCYGNRPDDFTTNAYCSLFARSTQFHAEGAVLHQEDFYLVSMLLASYSQLRVIWLNVAILLQPLSRILTGPKSPNSIVHQQLCISNCALGDRAKINYYS